MDVLDAIDRIATQEGDARTRAAIAIRRRNVAWYRRHEAEVGPLLHAWGGQ